MEHKDVIHTELESPLERLRDGPEGSASSQRIMDKPHGRTVRGKDETRL